MSDVLLEARNLRLGYGSRTVLDGVDLELRPGEFWFFLGPNGEGKTTLVRAILGLLEPQGGRIWRNPALVRRETAGFVPQRCDLNPGLPTTLGEFVRLGAIGTGLDRRTIRERLGRALAQVGLPGMERTSYWSLSGGQRQRALIARALIRGPDLLVLDEPTNGLDLPTEENVLGFLERLNREEGVTILFVTHDLQIAAHRASHVALFRAGRVSAGPREAMLTEERLAKVYGPGIRLLSEMAHGEARS